MQNGLIFAEDLEYSLGKVHCQKHGYECVYCIQS
jgi:hypothetical protein